MYRVFRLGQEALSCRWRLASLYQRYRGDPFRQDERSYILVELRKLQ
jgi:hypothetical protein